jgi:aconitate hydratase
MTCHMQGPGVFFRSSRTQLLQALCRIDTEDEVDYYRNGGIPHHVLRNLAA